MNVGDLIYHLASDTDWGIIMKQIDGQYLVRWCDGYQSWINMVNVAKLEAQ